VFIDFVIIALVVFILMKQLGNSRHK